MTIDSYTLNNSKTDTSPPQAGKTGPTPMQHFIVVTPLGKNHPYPGLKPIALMDGTDKLPQIAVTKPKMGFASDLGRTTSKYHPFFPPILVMFPRICSLIFPVLIKILCKQ